MLTVCCSGRRGVSPGVCVCLGGVCPGVVCAGGVCPRGVCQRGVCPGGCLSGGVCPRGMSTPVHAGIHTPLSSRTGGVCPSACWDTHPPRGQNDRHLWKYYLAATRLQTVNMAEKNYILLRQLYFVDWRTEGLYSDSKKIALAYPLWKVIPLNATTRYSCCKSFWWYRKRKASNH